MACRRDRTHRGILGSSTRLTPLQSSAVRMASNADTEGVIHVQGDRLAVPARAGNDAVIRAILQSFLENEGFTVLLAADGLEALYHAARTGARVVILDLKMPSLNGLATCARLAKG